MTKIKKMKKTAEQIRTLLLDIESLDFDWVELEDLLEELENIWDEIIFRPSIKTEKWW